MEGWTELQFDIRATYKGKCDDIHALVIERCEELVVGEYLSSKTVCTKQKSI